MRPSKPSWRRVSAALAPARLAPTMMWVWLLVMGCPRGQGQELLAGAGVVADEAVERRGHGLGAQLLNAAQRHAQVLGLQDDPDASGFELALEPVGDLRGQPLLDLEIAAEELDDAAELAEADDPLARQIPDVGDAVERKQVVHA